MMAIPPFPPQDLAKLVLGYLAEEELMTAYDEFLQASPYLDAFRNEYDRIFMTSLRTILADYRAVKIHVETCKPHLLRKKLLQCTNIFEIVKFLISLIDHHKLLAEDHSEKFSLQKSSLPKGITCEVCNPLNLKTCVCNSKISTTTLPQLINEENSTYNNSVEATSLQDLPGNSKCNLKPELGMRNSICLSTDQKEGQNKKQDNNSLSSTSIKQVAYDLSSINHNPLPVNQIPQVTKASCMDSKQKIEEFNNILNVVCNKSVTNEKLYDNIISNRISNEENFQNFANGVFGHHEKVTKVPDSSTTDVVMPIATQTAKENLISNIKGPPKQTDIQTSNNLASPTIQYENITGDKMRVHFPPNKIIGNKIRILSDVKIDKQCNVMPILKANVTSTTSQTGRTLLINGPPSLRQKGSNFSKDEIMAMPTLIIVPTSGPYNIISKPVTSTANNLHNSNDSKNKTVPTSEASAVSPKRRPIYIEVPSDNTSVLNDQKSTKMNDGGLVKTVDAVSHASLPKDNTAPSKSSTPQALPPLRKSSSTPRRSSHVRVLDFTTPRRILNEAIPEKEASDDSVVVLSDSPVRPTVNMVSDTYVPKNDNLNVNSNSEINIEQKVIKKRNWDEELRALVASTANTYPISVPKSSKKKKKVDDKSLKDNTNQLCSNSKTEATKVKKCKKKTKSSEDAEEPTTSDLKVDKKIKPTINIISASKHPNISEPENEDKLKLNDIENQIDTPENERLSLQNVIGAKLNISDLLETPYKQAIYDIQMETPKFLGPDLPDEPVSDIKIMNIPTPRFFDTPNPTQATPSSYSSRPTDYSSGGSYYKPDDQDYVPIPEVAACKITEAKSKNKVSKLSDNQKVSPNDTDVKSAKSRRPVRKCTKNVSYYNTSNVKEEKKEEEDEKKTNKYNVIREKDATMVKTKTVKSKQTKTNLEKHKSPFKKDTPKNFMKIKPRRVTPIKSTKNRKKSSELSISARKIVNLKENNHNASPTLAGVPTKSRRKSSTPRKLHCNKTFHSSTSSNTSPDLPAEQETGSKNVKICVTHDSDSEQQILRWSDDGSQDFKQKSAHEGSVTEGEDIITKIQEYIEKIETNKSTNMDIANRPLGSLQCDLVKRGFDLETAKIIERDLLDTPPIQDGVVQSTSNDTAEVNTNEKEIVKDSEKIEENVKDVMLKPEIQKDEVEHDDDMDENGDIDFDIKETDENTDNYFTYIFDETKYNANSDIAKLKDKFSMEVCIDDGVSIRLRATQFSVLLDQDPVEDKGIDAKELESAVTSISNIEKLYTPIKHSRERCYEIFDSTLTSLDTPLKPSSPKLHNENSVTEIVLEVENISSKADVKKRKRVQSLASDEGSNVKRTKADSQYLINPASIQNIDIESVLSKLHGP
ncbi:uncharacterized protein LOC119838365 [Zerene cesonia]|uniref:uncharacterized protein LOC119838365 n=1 Tax=Zerene cesonia TaxID=33412 RepID=UPI0018E4FE8E|nr:uncharacterized protein LOC119838365 [Zerene cesonia]